MNATYFSINLMQGGEYLLHVRVDFPDSKDNPQGAIVRNSSCGGKWLNEERSMSRRFPFLPGITADVRIVAGGDNARLWIDGEIFTNFTYRGAKGLGAGAKDDGYPISELMDQVNVVGDVALQKFQFK